MRIQTIDRFNLDGDTREKTAEGFLIAQAVATQSKVSNYSRGELGLDGDPEEVIGVYRTPETIFHEDTTKTLQLRPVTKGHPQDGVNPGDARLHMVGSTGENISKDEDSLRVSVSVFDEDSINMVEGGKNQVSLGYAWDIKEESGEINGVSYDYISDGPMTINHLALVDKGRLGPEVRVLDSAPEIDVDGEVQDTSGEEPVVSRTNTSETQDAYVSAEVFLNLYDSFWIDGEEMGQDIVGRITEMLQSALNSNGTASDSALDKAKGIAKDIAGDLEKSVNDRANKRADLLVSARDLLSEDKFNEVKDKDEKTILIAAVGDSVADIENRPIEYLRAALDFIPRQNDDAGGVSGRARASAQRRSTAGDTSPVSVTGTDELDKAYDDHDKYLRNAHRNPNPNSGGSR